MDMIVLGSAGLSGSRRIWQQEDCRRELLQRYPARFFRSLGEAEQEAGAAAAEEKESRRIRSFLKAQGIPEEDLREAGETGILGALWELLKEKKLGGVYHQKRIPVRQQTLEICELFGLNPYRLYGRGCFLCLTKDGGRLLMEGEAAGIEGALIGYTAKGPAIRRTDGEETAYLRRPEPEPWPWTREGEGKEGGKEGVR